MLYIYGLFFKNYDSGCGIKNALVLVQRTSFQQVIGLYTLQCQSEFTKVTNQSSKSLFRNYIKHAFTIYNISNFCMKKVSPSSLYLTHLECILMIIACTP